MFGKPSRTTFSGVPTSIFSLARKSFANIDAQRSLILSTEYLTTTNTNQGLHNPFSKKFATTEQQHNLIHFRHIGQNAFEHHVAYYILKEASVHPPIRKKEVAYSIPEESISEANNTVREGQKNGTKVSS